MGVRHRAELGAEGDVLAVPLDRGGTPSWALGLLVRRGDGIIVVYLFRPALAAIPKVPPHLGLADVIDVVRTWDGSLDEGEWPIIGPMPGWDPADWPVPDFAREDLLVPRRCWRVRYADDLSIATSVASVITLPEYQQLPQDGTTGAVSRLLTMLLGSPEDDHPGGPIEHIRRLDWTVIVHDAQERDRATSSPPVPVEEPERPPEDLLQVEVRLADDEMGSDADQGLLDALSDQLTAALEASSTGEYDGHEIGMGSMTLYMYGSDVDAMFDAVRLILTGDLLRAGSHAQLHHRAPGPRQGHIVVVDLAAGP